MAPHAEFTRDGLDLKLELPVTLGEAVLGGKVRVHTLDGAVVLTVPPGSNSGTVLKLAGKGLASGSARGNLLVTLKVVLPSEPDDVLKAFVTGWQTATPTTRGPKASLARYDPHPGPPPSRGRETETVPPPERGRIGGGQFYGLALERRNPSFC